MSKGLRITLIVVLSVLFLAAVAGAVAVKIIGEAFGTKCEKSRSWIVREYRIQEYQCLGWVGPQYYPLDLYRDGKRISQNGYRVDSCTMRFIFRNNNFLELNHCASRVEGSAWDQRQ